MLLRRINRFSTARTYSHKNVCLDQPIQHNLNDYSTGNSLNKEDLSFGRTTPRQKIFELESSNVQKNLLVNYDRTPNSLKTQKASKIKSQSSSLRSSFRINLKDYVSVNPKTMHSHDSNLRAQQAKISPFFGGFVQNKDEFMIYKPRDNQNWKSNEESFNRQSTVRTRKLKTGLKKNGTNWPKFVDQGKTELKLPKKAINADSGDTIGAKKNPKIGQLEARKKEQASRLMANLSFDNLNTKIPTENIYQQHKPIEAGRANPISTPPAKSKHKLFTRQYGDFLQPDELSKSAKKLGRSPTKAFQQIYHQQLLLDIPHIKVKAYFNCVSSRVMSDALHDDSVMEISEDFVRNEYAQKQHSTYDTNKYKREIAKTNNFKLKSQFNTNQRLLFEMKKKMTIRGVENFGIDVLFLEQFFDKKIRPKNLKFKSDPVQSPGQPLLDYENPEFPQIASNISTPSTPAHDSMSNAYNPQHPNMGSNEKEMGSGFEPTAKTERTRPNVSDLQSPLMLSKDPAEIYSNQVQAPSKLLLSFYDNVTFDNATFVNEEEFSMTKLNSKSYIDLSKIDWSMSAVSSVAKPVRLVSANRRTLCTQRAYSVRAE